MTKESNITVSIQSIISALGLLGMMIGSYVHTSSRMTELEVKLEVVSKQNDKMAPILTRLDKTVNNLIYVVDKFDEENGK